MKHTFLHFFTTLLLAFAAVCPAWAENYVTVGTAEGVSGGFPYNTSSQYSTTQSIYTASEMNGAKVITSIAYYVSAASSLSTTGVEIYMGHRSSSTFSSTSDYHDVSKMTLVYFGIPTLGQSTGWETRTLQTPFYYNGSDNLVVVVARQSANSAGWLNYNCFYTSTARCLIRGNNSSEYGIATNNTNYTISGYRPYTRFGYGFDVEQGGIGYIYTSSTTATVAGATSNDTSVTIPSTINSHNVTNIVPCAFWGKTNLKEVVIPNTVTSIGDYAFYNCSNLRSLTIGSDVKSIGSNAFNYKPTKVIWLPDAPPTGYAQANGLVNYTPNESYTSLENVKVYPYLRSYFEVDGIKYAITSTADRTCDAFDCSYTDNTANVSLAPTVTYRNLTMKVDNLNDYLCTDNDNIKSVNIDHTGSVPQSAFHECTNMETLKLKDVETIDQYAFYRCKALQTADLGQSLKTIGKYAFNDCSSLEAINIPNSVQTIDDWGFYYCKNAKELSLGTGVKSIGNRAFGFCKALSDVVIPANVNSIGQEAFAACTELRNFIISDRTTPLSLGSNLFYYLSPTPIESLYVGGKLSYSGTSSFAGNTTLRTVVFNDQEETIYDEEFKNCSNLQNVHLGNGVKTIGASAFAGCGMLDKVSFGNSVESIGAGAFTDCIQMTEIVSENTTPPVCGNLALADIDKWSCQLYVPTASISAYQKADQWKDFLWIDNNTGKTEGAIDRSKQYTIDGSATFGNSAAFTTEQLTYNRTYSTDWEALYLPFTMAYSDWAADFTVARINAFYQYDDDRDGHIDRSVLEAVVVKDGVLEPNCPYLVKAKRTGATPIVLANATVCPSDINSIDCSTIDSRFVFTGNYANLDGSQLTTLGAYIMNDGRLTEATSTSTLAPFRWYLQVEDRNANGSVATSNRREIRIAITDEPSLTGIEYARLGLDAEQDSSIYSIDGRRVQQPTQRGIYIVNGKKQVVR